MIFKYQHLQLCHLIVQNSPKLCVHACHHPTYSYFIQLSSQSLKVFILLVISDKVAYI